MSWKGEPGPRHYESEVQCVRQIRAEFERAIRAGERINMPDGENHKIAIDAYTLFDATELFNHYEMLLTKQLHELIPPIVFYSGCVQHDADSISELHRTIDLPELQKHSPVQEEQ